MDTESQSAAPFTAPPWTLTSLEPVRAAWEYAGMRLMSKAALPPGDGHAIVLFPGLAIIFTALSLQLLGDGVRDLLDPKLKKTM